VDGTSGEWDEGGVCEVQGGEEGEGYGGVFLDAGDWRLLVSFGRFRHRGM